MPEEGLETAELREKLEETTEHAHGGGHEEHKAGEPWIVQLSLTTAIIAVLAAIAALFSGGYANQALSAKNEAILALGEETDAWAFYQAKSIKKAIYDTQSEAVAASNAQQAATYKAKAQKEEAEQAEPRKTAEGAKATKKAKMLESDHAFHVHHQFAYSVTFFQVAIALAAISALTKRKALWITSMVVGLGGLGFFANGFLVSSHHEGAAEHHEGAAPAHHE